MGLRIRILRLIARAGLRLRPDRGDGRLQARVTEIAGTMEALQPVNLAIGLVLAVSDVRAGLGTPLLLASIALVAVAATGLFTLPGARLSRIRYRSDRSAAQALVGFSLAIGAAWGLLIAVLAASVGLELMPAVLCTGIGAMSIGGIYLSVMPRAAITFTGALAIGCTIAISIGMPAAPLLFYLAVLLYTILLVIAVVRQSAGFDARIRAGARLTETLRERSEQEKAALVRERERERSVAEAKAADRTREAERRRAEMVALAGRFEQSVVSVVGALAAAAEHLTASTGSLETISAGATRHAAAVNERAESASSAVAAVAAASRQLHASVREISGLVEAQVDATERVKQLTDEGDGTMAALSADTGNVTAIVELIRQIAHQTNLLALNATIEAARAGELGRGFAVVAGEVKTLAGETESAIESVGATVGAIEGRIGAAADAIGNVAGQAERVAEQATQIANAVQQQSLAACDIEGSAARAEEDAECVRAEMQRLAASASEAGALIERLRGLADDLAARSQALSAATDDFLAHLSAA